MIECYQKEAYCASGSRVLGFLTYPFVCICAASRSNEATFFWNSERIRVGVPNRIPLGVLAGYRRDSRRAPVENDQEHPIWGASAIGGSSSSIEP